MFIGQQHLWNPYSIDSARLFTPISTVGVFYVVYSAMKMITQYGGQYAIKVSYSKDKVLLPLLRNSCL
jgi:threonine/homoserine/homoserine lactone efflux protein